MEKLSQIMRKDFFVVVTITCLERFIILTDLHAVQHYLISTEVTLNIAEYSRYYWHHSADSIS